MQKRVLLLPIVWGAYGIGEVIGLTYIFGPVLNSVPFSANDKPISGSYLPALFFNVGATLAMIGLSLYALGVFNVDLTDPKSKRNLGALVVLVVSGGLVFVTPLALFPLIIALIYLLATNID